MSFSTILTVAIVGLLLFGLKTQWIDNSDTIFRNPRFENGIIEDVATPLNINFNNDIRLIGAEIDNNIASGETATIHLYWTLSGEPIEHDYSTIVQLVDSQGIVIAETSNFYPGGLATRNWLPGYYVEDVIMLDIPQFTAPKSYDVVIGVFLSDNGQRLDILNEAGNPIGIDADLSVLQVERPDSFPASDELPITSLAVSGLQLLSVNDLPDTVQVGDEMTFSWLWRGFNPGTAITPQLYWETSDAVLIPDIVIDYPVEEWQAGDVWRGYHRAYVPARLPEGRYTIYVRVGGSDTAVGHAMNVTVPERDFDIPEIENELETIWQNGIHLEGYEQNDSEISFYWQTESLIDESLRLFVQVFNEEGQILAIDDGIPVNGQRPTSSWIPEEFITTRHIFDDLPPGDYRLLIGWYRFLTGERILLLDSNDDKIELMFSQ